ncbi:phage holin family protein [Crenobacter sp. SG2303]|uniref:Phage holin family protein n=1 Tax=Crenobacter oryzisoli TaxID=3056844 RepID=A0ABT7XPF9_9NEIS|nr:phage holin family protein [Crenobacter sp. SG2303]MDN0075593.1 phage holin family protein [Crenobacter sp. SG2303]
MTLPTLFELSLLGVIVGRVVLFERHGADHRPYAALLAYLIAAAAGIAAILLLFGQLTPTDPFRLVLLAVLCAALLAVRGNVVELFRGREQEPDHPFIHLLRKTRWF